MMAMFAGFSQLILKSQKIHGKGPGSSSQPQLFLQEIHTDLNAKKR
jgi:hypothetical protein